MALSDLLVAAGIGVAFGFALERAGLGSARKLTGQFFLTDLTVFKVMFSAIVTAMLGTFWLGQLGLMDLSFLYVPGLCPGTSCVAAASGRGDGAAVAAGLLAGVTITGLAFRPLAEFYESGRGGAWTLPQLLHLPAGIVVCLVVVVALAAFVAAERIEERP
jgi:hypothetical protein